MNLVSEPIKCKKCNSVFMHQVSGLKCHCVECDNVSQYNIDEIANKSWFINRDAAYYAMLDARSVFPAASVRQVDVDADVLIKRIKESQPPGAASKLTDLLIDIVEFVRRNHK